MRTKSFLTAGALAMLMAACSNEELITENVQLSEDRPLAGNVVLTPVFGDDAESRAIWTGTKHVFSEASDRFGVMLMDEWTYKPATGFGAYTFVDYIQTNYPFASEDGGYTWKSVAGAPLCEGNYFFYFPYNPAMTGRGDITFSVPAKQTNVTAEGKVEALEAVNQYQKYLGYAFVEATETDVNEVTPNFNFVFANPKFKIKNATGAALKVTKLLVRAHENGNIQKLPTAVKLAPANSFNAENYLVANGDRKLELAELQNALAPLTEGATYEYVITFGDEHVIPAGEYLKASAVIPGGEYGQLDVYAFVEEQNSEKDCGIIRLNETNNVNWDGQSQSGAMQTHMKPGITQVYTATVYAQSVGNLGVEGFTVVNSEDLAYVIDLKAKDGGREKVKITTWGDEVELSKDVYELISAENRKGIQWYIDGTIVIPANAAKDAVDQLSTGWDANTTIINKGTQELAKAVYNCNIINEGTITEKAGVSVTINGNVTNTKTGNMTVSAVYGDVDNKGAINVGYVAGNVHNGKYMAEKDDDTVAPVTTATADIVTVDKAYCSVRNWGVMKLNNQLANGNMSLSNKSCGKLEIAGGYVYFVTNRGGVVTVSEKSTIYGLSNDGGIVNVNADLTIANQAKNYNDEHNTVSTINIAENVAMTGKIVNNYDCVINAKGTLDGNVLNAGLINVIENGIVIVEGGVENQGVVSYGVIDVTAANEDNAAFAAKCNDTENMMTFAYTVGAEDDATELVATLKNKISSKNYGKNPVKLTWGENSAETFEGRLNTPNVTIIKIENNLTVKSYTLFEDAETFVVDGYLTVANGATLDLGSAENAVVNGTLKANNQSTLKGEVEVEGKGIVVIETANSSWTEADSFGGKWYE